MKRVDLILSERELDKVTKAIEASGAPGYSVMKHVTGKGPYGEVSDAMDFSGLGANAHVILFCEPEILPKLREGIQPLLDYYGGVAFVAEANPLYSSCCLRSVAPLSAPEKPCNDRAQQDL